MREFQIPPVLCVDVVVFSVVVEFVCPGFGASVIVVLAIFVPMFQSVGLSLVTQSFINTPSKNNKQRHSTKTVSIEKCLFFI